MNARAAQSDSVLGAQDGEFAFSPRNFSQIASLLRERTGIALSAGKATLVYSRLAKRVRKLGLADFDAYCALVQSAEGAAECEAMIAALTTNVTRFFREPHHFEHLRNKVAQELSEKLRRGERVRLWSAACSSGEEPYSIAMTLLDAMPDLPRGDLRILATDIDPNVLEKGRAGLYSHEATSPIPNGSRERWMQREGGGWRVRDEVRALVAFKDLNLIGDWPMRGRFDVVFCRNVVIYFEDQTQANLWNRFRTVLAPGGRLYVGHSERVDVDGFASDGLTIYRVARGLGQ